MQSISICLVGFGMVAVGSILMYLQFHGVKRFETLIAGAGVALIACGAAVVNDGASGSREILWMLPKDGQQIESYPLSSIPLQGIRHL